MLGLSKLSSLLSLFGKRLTGTSLQKGSSVVCNFSEQSAQSFTSDPTVQRYLARGYKMSLRKGTSRPNLFRFLLAKLIYDVDEPGLSVEEYLVLNELYFDFCGSSDPTFVKKYGEDLKVLQPFFETMAGVRTFPLRVEEEFRKELIDAFRLEVQMFPSPQAYYGLKGTRDLKRSYSVSFRGEFWPRARNQRFVGVGYKDHGTRRNVATNGSPAWQDVAQLDLDHEFAERAEAEDSGASTLSPQGEVEH